MVKREAYTTIDLLKFIFSIMIVAIHTGLLDVNTSYSAWMISSMLFRTGVPFFFVVSGFFLADKLFSVSEKAVAECRIVVKKYCTRLLPPLMLWGGIGLLIDIVNYCTAGIDILHIMWYSFRTLFYPSNAMWYLLASVIGAVILNGMYVRFNDWKKVWLIYAVIAYIFLLLCNNYYFVVEGSFLGRIMNLYSKVFVSARNGVFLAPVYMGMGFIIRCDDTQKWLKKHRSVVLIGLICGFVLLSIEASLLFGCTPYDDRGYFISQLLLVPSLVVAAMQFPVKLKLPYRTLRRLSTSIFYVHKTILFAIASLIGVLLPPIDTNLVVFLATTVIAIIISLLTYRTNNRHISKFIG